MTPIPFRQFVLKVHSRCNIACDYCYVYEHADQTWRDRPLAMTQETVQQTARRIAEHLQAHRIAEARVVLHGGEPLLFGVERTRMAIETLRKEIEPHSRLDLRVHTNGLLLNKEFCDLFVVHDVKVGVSLDGDKPANDRHRTFANGRSSHSAVRTGLALLRTPAYQHLYAGLLCVVDVRNDPIAVYEALSAEKPPRVDLLLPHSTWDQPPPRPTGSPTEYGQWLGAVHDRWRADGRPFEIRTFDSIRGALRGLPSRTESLGLTPADLVVVETDGSIEQLDSMKTAYDGAPATGLDVFSATLDEAAEHEGIEARQQGLAGLCTTCRRCPVVSICGGGLYPHRYSHENGFKNPSVYCQDLQAIITHIRAAEAVAAVPAESREEPHTHALSAPVFADLASGYGDSTAVRQLANGQKSLRRALLAAVLEALAGSGPHSEAASLIAELDSSCSAALGVVLEHPYTRVWAVRCLDGIRRGSDVSSDLMHINGLALAAAAHAGVTAEFELLARNGAVHVPTFGAALVQDRRTVRARTANGALTIDSGTEVIRVGPDAPPRHATEGRWQPVRLLTAPGYLVRLEDTDPYRDCHHWRPAERLSAERARHWQDSFAGAITLIDDELPAYADGLRSGLHTVMPIAPQPGRGDASAAARHAFGAIGADLPGTPAALALLLVHEFQHVKLGALLDLFDLFDKGDTAPRHYAPWRPDPRPLEGLFQGAYAHIGVTEYWRNRRQVTAGGDAEVQFARWRVHTAEALDVLLDSGSLTPLGTRFVEAMRETVHPWCDEPVSAAARDSAHAASAAHRAAYDAQMSATA